MRSIPACALILVALVLLPAICAAQEPVRSFDELNTRLKPGDTVWVTDAQGREVKGRIVSIRSDELALDSDTAIPFPAGSVRLVREREDDSVWKGTIIGGSVGAALGLSFGSFSGSWRWSDAAAGAVMFGGIFAGVGLAVDALIPGKKIVVYRGPAAAARPSAHVAVAPLVTPRAKGIAASVAF
jgi:hypothetical protein